ncbi:hypothetical protein C457_03226 [Haloferax prahovense DSM 18310]|uniref:Uncharacterized protein n=1 Tax=Haloferax prahovense (strain DSM 18310 / JCM 13924 / TL6) TaxID=1227461 RepID=M0GL52_HALPT|nr:hypothetical protein C457_03226 [Haloferax prahovense DSM 18310]
MGVDSSAGAELLVGVDPPLPVGRPSAPDDDESPDGACPGESSPDAVTWSGRSTADANTNPAT